VTAVRTVVLQTPRFKWIDVSGPSPVELEALATEYGIHPLSVQDCLEPEHLPKYERIGAVTFVILRSYDENARPEADTVHQLTRKVALFFNADFLLTVHRAEQRFLEELKQQPPRPLSDAEQPCALHVLAIANGVIDTFWSPLEEAERSISMIEEGRTKPRDRSRFIHEVFHLKRRINSIRSTTRHTLETVRKLAAASEEHVPPSPRLNDVRENAESLYFATDELLEDANSLISLTLAAADHETNQVMKVLTVFSAFFLPLTFIVGVYGMNFDAMPELRWRFGYPVVWGAMIACSLGIYLWFHRRGWL
jgi:magnesium transporter